LVWPLVSSRLHSQGRKIKVKQTAAGVASFDFQELCGTPSGAADYLALARSLPTFYLLSSLAHANQATRTCALAYDMACSPRWGERACLDGVTRTLAFVNISIRATNIEQPLARVALMRWPARMLGGGSVEAAGRAGSV